ncbi:MAG: ABC transporter substrate-binding protein, partial [Treponema sp.]|nr:ABC transporter substrate-binding protein [Treponema sp.]
ILSGVSCSRKAGANRENSGIFIGPAEETPLEGGALRFGLSTEPVTLDPLNPANTADGRSILFNVFEGLVKPDTGGNLLPAAAESWTIDQGGLVYHFLLREGLQFHDGSRVSAGDVKFTLEMAAKAGFAGFTEISAIEALGDRDIRITLKEQDPEFLPYITIGIVPANNSDREKNPIGAGPFFIESYTPQQSLVLKKNPHYREKGLPHLDTVTIVFTADSDALLLSLQGGTIDGATVTGPLVQQLDNKKFDVVPDYSASVQLLALNNAVTPLDNVRVRQAINYGIDVKEIIDAAFYGRGEASGSPLIPGLTVYYNDSLADPYPVDREKAHSLLADSPFGGGFPLEITIPSNYTMHVDTAQVIVNQLSKIGITASIKLVDWATWLTDVYRDRRFQATIISLDANTVSPRGFLSRYRSGAGSNFINFKSAAFDQIFDEAQIELDESKRIALYKEAQRIISDEAAGVYIQDIQGFKAFRKNSFRGAVSYPLYIVDFAPIYRIK